MGLNWWYIYLSAAVICSLLQPGSVNGQRQPQPQQQLATTGVSGGVSGNQNHEERSINSAKNLVRRARQQQHQQQQNTKREYRKLQDDREEGTFFEADFQIIYLLDENIEPISDDPNVILTALMPLVDQASVLFMSVINELYEEMGDPFNRIATSADVVDGETAVGMFNDNGMFVKQTAPPTIETMAPKTPVPTKTMPPKTMAPKTAEPTLPPSTIPPTVRRRGIRGLMDSYTNHKTGMVGPAASRLLQDDFGGIFGILALLVIAGNCNGCPSNAALTNQIITIRRKLQDGELSNEEIIRRMDELLRDGNLQNEFGGIIGVAQLDELRDGDDDDDDSSSSDDGRRKGNKRGKRGKRGKASTSSSSSSSSSSSASAKRNKSSKKASSSSSDEEPVVVVVLDDPSSPSSVSSVSSSSSSKSRKSDKSSKSRRLRKRA